MAVTVEASGTQTAVINTEHTLHTNTGAKVLILLVNAVNMALGDTLELRVNTRLLATGVANLAYFAGYSHVQGEPVKASIPLPATGQTSNFTLKQTAGTGRAYDWTVVSVG